MNWYFISVGVVVVVSGSIVLGFVIRDWPKLTLLDAKKLPEVKEHSKKNEILRRRVAKEEAAKTPSPNIVSLWCFDLWQRIQKKFREQVDILERMLLSEKMSGKQVPLTDEEIGAQHRQIKALLHSAENALQEKAYDTAEKAFISVLSLDDRNAAAYFGLGNVYFAEEQYREAKETYQYAVRLDKRNELALARLAEIAEIEGKIETAVDYYEQLVLLNDSVSPRFYKLYELLLQLNQPATALAAIEQALYLEPQNPKYLDNFITASILVGDKKRAEDGYQRLRMVNPDNQKLASFKERIDTL